MKYRSKSILAHIPHNQQGKAILQQALFFQKALGMRIFVMDFIKSNTFFFLNPKSKRNQIRHLRAVNRFTEFVKEQLHSEIPNNIILRIGWGKSINNLITESEQGGYEFLILDKNKSLARSAFSKTEFDKCISKSFCPVLAINKDYPIDKINKIVIPIDISQRTKKRLYWATFFAKKLNAKIQIVSALNVKMDETKSLAYKKAEKLKEMLENRGVQCDVKILNIHKQQHHTAVLEYIEKEKPELIIIRTHQEYRFTGKKINKFVSEIVHGCPMPVFTVGGITQNYDINLI